MEGKGSEQVVNVEVLSVKEYRERFGNDRHAEILLRNMEHGRYCRADVLRNGIVGTFSIPNKEDLSGTGALLGFYLTRESILFVEDVQTVARIMKEMKERDLLVTDSIAQFFFEFVEMLIRNDMFFLQEYEEHLAKLEEMLLSGRLEAFDRKILKIRKEILSLLSYYEQLIDVSEVLEENLNEQFTEVECRVFHTLSKRVDRLYDNTRTLKEYSLQLWEMYQSQIDMRQNMIMKVLTIVTTIFMPLTLITGWYGMNFTNMPELRNPYGYFIMAGISIAIILFEIWVFKIKKWFR